jgi:hypothetical protein
LCCILPLLLILGGAAAAFFAGVFTPSETEASEDPHGEAKPDAHGKPADAHAKPDARPTPMGLQPRTVTERPEPAACSSTSPTWWSI